MDRGLTVRSDRHLGPAAYHDPNRNGQNPVGSPALEQVDAERSLLAVELSLVQLNADELNALIGL